MKLSSPAVKEAFSESKQLSKESFYILSCGIALFLMSILSPFTLLIPVLTTAVVTILALRFEKFSILESERVLVRLSFLGSLISTILTLSLPFNQTSPVLTSLSFFLEFIIIYWFLTYLELRRIL